MTHKCPTCGNAFARKNKRAFCSDRCYILHASVVPEGGGCWIWTRGRNAGGYGTMRYRGVHWLAHRVSYEVFIGAIPEGLTVDHRCFEPACVNPTHLRLMTHEENARRQRSTFSDQCQRGHKYTYPAGGRRYCRECKRRAAA